MKEWLVFLSEHAIVLIDFAAMIVIVAGTVEVLINATRVFLTPVSGHEWREVWLRYASWLVAGLTPQLGADFATPYIRHILGFIGIKDVTFIEAARLNFDADKLEKARAEITAKLVVPLAKAA